MPDGLGCENFLSVWESCPVVQGSDGHRSCGFSCEMYLNIVSHVSFVKSVFRLKAHDHFPEDYKFNLTATFII